jgi:cytochrome b
MRAPTVQVWDPLVRLFHWSLVASVAIAWLTADAGDRVHGWAGYAAAGPIAVRLLWGIGPKYARFSRFVRSPRTVVQYLGQVVRGSENRATSVTTPPAGR